MAHGTQSTSSEGKLSLSSRLVHADNNISVHRAVAPAMHVSTTFRYTNDPELLDRYHITDPLAPLDTHIYTRYSNPNMNRLEAILTSLLGGPSLTYSSGLAAYHAMLVFLNPRRIFINKGYAGSYDVIALVSRLTGLQKLDLFDDIHLLQAGDVIHIETPMNPTGEARDLQHYADVAHAVGAYLTVDATFAPPPLQDPLAQGADIVIHSGTKYIGGHSDMLCGVLTIGSDRLPGGGGDETRRRVHADRLALGSVPGSLEGWLGIRSLRTLELRILRQSRTAEGLVNWFVEEQSKGKESVVGSVMDGVLHASLQPEAKVEQSWLRKQMSGGYGPVFAILMKSEWLAKRVPSRLRLFHHATSLGGVESMIEWRAMFDDTVSKSLLRVSVGVEALEDLIADFEQAFEFLKGDDSFYHARAVLDG